MKRIFQFALLTVTLAVAPNLLALTVNLQGGSGYGPWQTGIGGEFTWGIDNASLLGTIGGPGGYATTTANQGGPGTSFQSFCVEVGEHISANGSYSAAYNSRSVFSNVQLTRGAAYLYSQFASGALANYNYGVGRQTSASLLQHAIWMLMGQETIGNNAFVTAAANALGGLAAANSTAGVGEYNVYVLNLWDSSGKAAQDQLIYTTGAIPNIIDGVPDGGLTAMMLGMGFTGLAFVSRRIRRR